MAGVGIKRANVIGKTDDFGYNWLADPVHIRDLQATVMPCLGVDHTKLTCKLQGRHFRLTDVDGQVEERALSQLDAVARSHPMAAAPVLYRLLMGQHRH